MRTTSISLVSLAGAALLAGASAAAAEPTAASDVRWARPFALARAETWTMSGAPHPFTEGLLVELRVDPALAEPREGRHPVLFVGDQPVFRFNWDTRGGCVVGFVPGAVDLTTAEVYFGADELPERLDPGAAAQALAAARSAGVRPLPTDRVAAALAAGGAPLQAADLRDVHREAMARVAACSATPEDHQRAGATNR